MAKKAKLSKSEQIGEWKEKGIDWLVNRLWEARKCNEELKQLNAKVRHDALSIRGYWKVEEINRNLAYLFSKVGMKPTLLTVYYTEKTCDGCPDWHVDGEDGYCEDSFPSWDCYYSENKIIETISVYDYRMKGDVLSGVLTDFNDKEIEVVKVVAKDTGEILCDFSDKEQEESE